ncbi:hypothetical protein ACFRJ8_16310 [Arthrobacter sp. NPDC056886]|uniref:hypothetical protein n=1 Tax=Arthrobacter sp. NPDC056886 TaxID=3345960 RepID=UPI0036722377
MNEHNQWLRNEKMAASSEFLAATERLVNSELQSRSPRVLANAVQEARNLSHARLTLVCPMDVASSALKLRESVVDVATLLAERSRIGPDEAWDEQVNGAFAKAYRSKIQFVLESSKDLNSGIFKGLGPFRAITMSMLRWKVRLWEKKLV